MCFRAGFPPAFVRERRNSEGKARLFLLCPVLITSVLRGVHFHRNGRELVNVIRVYRQFISPVRGRLSTCHPVGSSSFCCFSWHRVAPRVSIVTAVGRGALGVPAGVSAPHVHAPGSIAPPGSGLARRALSFKPGRVAVSWASSQGAHSPS